MSVDEWLSVGGTALRARLDLLFETELIRQRKRGPRSPGWILVWASQAVPAGIVCRSGPLPKVRRNWPTQSLSSWHDIKLPTAQTKLPHGTGPAYSLARLFR